MSGVNGARDGSLFLDRESRLLLHGNSLACVKGRRSAVFNLLSLVFIGLLVGIIAKGVLPGRDPGVPVTVLFGTASTIAGWSVGHAIGWDGQPWQFFLSIGAALVFLHIYRESGIDDTLAERAAEAEKQSIAERAIA